MLNKGHHMRRLVRPAAPSGGAAENLIPVMTSNTTPSGIASTGTASSTAFYSFDQDPGTAGGTTGGGGSFADAWWEYEFPTAETITKYGLLGSGLDITAWEFKGWNGASWDVLDSQTAQALSTSVVTYYEFTNTTAYARYRIHGSAGNIWTLQFKEIEMWG